MTPTEPPFTINRVSARELDELLVLVRADCDFYAVAPTDHGLRALMIGLLAAGVWEGLQLLAGDTGGEPV